LCAREHADEEWGIIILGIKGCHSVVAVKKDAYQTK
jgi:hypothetical protein